MNIAVSKAVDEETTTSEQINIAVQEMYGGGASPGSRCFPPVSRAWDETYNSFVHFMKNLPVHHGIKIKNMEILDAGCGTGAMITNLAAALPEARFTGIDFTKQSLIKAQSLSEERELQNIRLLEDNLLNLKISQNKERFDMIYSWGVLHHTADAKQAFLNTAKLLKPNGLYRCGIYGEYGNETRRNLRASIKELFNGKPLEEKIDLVRKWLKANPELLKGYVTEPQIPLSNFDKQEHPLNSDAYIADEFLHVHENHFTLAEIAAWYKEAGLKIVGLTDFNSNLISLKIEDYADHPDVISMLKGIEGVPYDAIDRLKKPYWISLIGQKPADPSI